MKWSTSWVFCLNLHKNTKLFSSLCISSFQYIKQWGEISYSAEKHLPWNMNSNLNKIFTYQNTHTHTHTCIPALLWELWDSCTCEATVDDWPLPGMLERRGAAVEEEPAWLLRPRSSVCCKEFMIFLSRLGHLSKMARNSAVRVSSNSRVTVLSTYQNQSFPSVALWI